MLVSPTDDEYDFLIRRLTQLVSENQGECVYAIGESGKCHFVYLWHWKLPQKIALDYYYCIGLYQYISIDILHDCHK